MIMIENQSRVILIYHRVTKYIRSIIYSTK
nr:MAG TPA: PROTEIN/RNA Complex, translation arrest, mifm, L22.9A [Caudoviricetes sp.]